MEKIKVTWAGPQFSDHSLSIVNRNICRYLHQDQQIELGKKLPKTEMPFAHDLTYAKDEKLSSSDITIVHQWPPDWSMPQSGKWVCMQPWEYGAVPNDWYIPMKYWVDEIWVYSEYNKESYIRCGIPENKIHVMPLGVDENIFHPGAPALPLELSSFCFLFVGGTIARKGIDILIQAYLDEFSAEEDVCLFIKDNGNHSFYKGITLEEIIITAMSNPRNPRIQYSDRKFSELELAGLYKACDCLVHPYRGEGFGLPIVEAMACGIPVIVPNQGPSRDFCSEETAFFVSSKEVALSKKKISNLETVDYPWWLSIDGDDLQQKMRFAYENRKLVKEKGIKASKQILDSYTWGNSAQLISNRIKQLVKNEQ
jgi:glycosyltransferase involved in cell wall biosynthesis